MAAPPYDRAAAERLLAEIRSAFEAGDPDRLLRVTDPDGTDENTAEYTRLLVRAGYKVASATIEAYTRPNWGILKTHDFDPPPACCIEIVLCNDRGGEEELYYACGPGEGGLRVCGYKEKEKRRKKGK